MSANRLSVYHPIPSQGLSPTIFTTATLSFPPFSRDIVYPPQLFIPPTPQSSYPSPTLSAADKYPLPSLDPSQGQQAHFWGGGSTGSSHSVLAPSLLSNTPPSNSISYLAQSTPYSTLPSSAARTLPTPPTSSSDTEARPFSQVSREEYCNVAVTLAQATSLMSTHDSGSNISSTSGLAARRQQHPLPQFHLNTTRPPYTSFGNVLTPPSGGPNEMTSPLSSGASSVGAVSTMGSFSPVGSVGYWPSGSGNASYGYNSASSNPSYTSGGMSNAPNSSFGMRVFSSPGSGGPLSLNRGNSRPSSPATGDLVPQSAHYENSASSFPGGTPMTAGAGGHPITASAGSGLPSIGQGSNAHSYPGAYIQQAPQAPSGSPPHPPINSQPQPQDSYSPLPPPTPSQPSYYNHQQNSPYPTSPPLQMSGNPSASMMGRPVQSPHYPPLIPLQPNYKPNYPPLPGMGGQVMGPGGMLAGHPHAMMSHHHQQQQQAERPYKCDQCPQSFNRNHDLKRHKRIHLAVKPFPCSNCEKSFSRKDALKVRISLIYLLFTAIGN